MILKKYQNAGQAVCVYVYAFRKRPGCALIGACALIITNTVSKLELMFPEVRP